MLAEVTLAGRVSEGLKHKEGDGFAVGCCTLGGG